MKIKYTLLVIVLITAGISCRVTADSEGGVAGTKNGGLSVDGSHDRENETDDPTKKGNAVNLGSNGSRSREQLDPKGKENEVKKGNGGDQIQRDERKDNERSSSESKMESKKGRSLPVREKCDSSSNRCSDDDKTLVACLRVPGNESPALSLLILNKGKGSQSITISASDSVKLDRKEIELQENKDTEIEVSVRDAENGHFIVLTAGHGNCSLDFKDERVGRKIDDHTPTSSNLSISKLTSSAGILFLGGLVIAAGVSVFMCAKSGRKYFARKGPKYQRLDMELPVSHGSNPGAGGNEGWDNSWGESWDDEEASITPSLPVTPSLSSRKFKEGWKD
ncbi:hypothetical protein C2S52_008370 [Perilla frutescens var. hirtella]|nr:hypothetical protein C2S51_017909 [Perilla frutescens var. frutescens]KAH6783411.1 hypothetical protein C2S52_008370 [Perilla frutescens var. hirtella]